MISLSIVLEQTRQTHFELFLLCLRGEEFNEA